MRILGFGAHPDDAEIFFFGTLAMAQASGADIAIAIATDGAAGGDKPGKGLARTRRAEAEAAAAMLGVAPSFLDFPDGGLATAPVAAAKVEDALAGLRPDLVITHAPDDYHPDHRALSALVRDAARFRAPVLYAEALMGVGPQPTHLVDITPVFAQKRAAIACHKSQKPERFVEACTTWNRFRSLQANAPAGYAEAFRFDPVYPFADIRGFLPLPPTVTPLRRF